jgi:cold shock CspA family protein
MSKHGQVKWYNDCKEYGFIRTDSGESVLACRADIKDAEYLTEFQGVRFDQIEDRATNIIITTPPIGDNEYIDTSTPTHIVYDTPRIAVYENVIPLKFCLTVLFVWNTRVGPVLQFVITRLTKCL